MEDYTEYVDFSGCDHINFSNEIYINFPEPLYEHYKRLSNDDPTEFFRLLKIKKSKNSAYMDENELTHKTKITFKGKTVYYYSKIIKMLEKKVIGKDVNFKYLTIAETRYFPNQFYEELDTEKTQTELEIQNLEIEKQKLEEKLQDLDVSNPEYDETERKIKGIEKRLKKLKRKLRNIKKKLSYLKTDKGYASKLFFIHLSKYLIELDAKQRELIKRYNLNRYGSNIFEIIQNFVIKELNENQYVIFKDELRAVENNVKMSIQFNMANSIRMDVFIPHLIYEFIKKVSGVMGLDIGDIIMYAILKMVVDNDPLLEQAGVEVKPEDKVLYEKIIRLIEEAIEKAVNELRSIIERTSESSDYEIARTEAVTMMSKSKNITTVMIELARKYNKLSPKEIEEIVNDARRFVMSEKLEDEQSSEDVIEERYTETLKLNKRIVCPACGEELEYVKIHWRDSPELYNLHVLIPFCSECNEELNTVLDGEHICQVCGKLSEDVEYVRGAWICSQCQNRLLL